MTTFRSTDRRKPNRHDRLDNERNNIQNLPRLTAAGMAAGSALDFLSRHSERGMARRRQRALDYRVEDWAMSNDCITLSVWKTISIDSYESYGQMLHVPRDDIGSAFTRER